MSELSKDALFALSNWIDGFENNKNLPPEALMHRRINKVYAEAGEVADAVSGMLGENPRKGRTHTLVDVCYELLDVATAALGAWAHLHENADDPLDALDRHIIAVAQRAGLVVGEPPINPHDPDSFIRGLGV